ncbi:hypothetical protein CHUAL_011072 [Chamberlinius hualienensis]
MSQTQYNWRVLIGNWSENSQHDKKRENIILNRIKNENLLTIRTKKISENVNREVNFSTLPCGFINYGDRIQISVIDSNLTWNSLSTRVSPDLILGNAAKCQHLQMYLSPSNGNLSSPKTTFTIRDVQTSFKRPLRYGDTFMLATQALEKEWYLSCRSITSRGITNCKPSDVFLDKSMSGYTRWNLQHADPQWRVEYDGNPVGTSESFFVSNTTTNQLLTITRLPEKSITVSRDNRNASLWKFKTGL